MATLLDTMAAVLFGLVLTLNVLRMHETVSARAHIGSLDLTVQSTAEALTRQMEAELRKAGYGVFGPVVLHADSTRFRFRADLNGDGSPDTLSYFVGSPSTAPETPNPADRHLVRERSGAPPVSVRAGITDFQFTYFTDTGDSTHVPSDLESVRKIRIDAVLESPAPYGATYARTRMRLAVRPYHLGF